MAEPGAPLPPGSFDTRVPTVIAVVAITLTVATAAVGLRIYTRKYIINNMGFDDYFAIFALLLAYGTGVAIGCMTKFGLGKHIWMVDIPVMLPLYRRAFYVSIVMYCGGLFAIKMTFLLQYYRVFAVQRMRIVFIATTALVGAWSISQLLIGIFICKPIRGFWDSSIPSKCVPNYPQFYINAAGNIATDIVVFALPLPLLWKLNLGKPQRIMLVGIFSLGFFTVAISVLRIKYLKLSEDATWDNVESSSWSIAELSSGITCACLPTLRPFLSRHFPALGSRLDTAPTTHGYHRQGDGPRSSKSAANDVELAGGRTSDSAGSRDGLYRSVTPASSKDVHYGFTRENSAEGIIGGLEAPEKAGFRLTVKARVEAGGRSALRRPEEGRQHSGSGIRVQRSVYQTRQERGPDR